MEEDIIIKIEIITPLYSGLKNHKVMMNIDPHEFIEALQKIEMPSPGRSGFLTATPYDIAMRIRKKRDSIANGIKGVINSFILDFLSQKDTIDGYNKEERKVLFK